MAEIRNYTMNFSFDITFGKRKLVSTETRFARFEPQLGLRCANTGCGPTAAQAASMRWSPRG
jgi:hypothetical protein